MCRCAPICCGVQASAVGGGYPPPSADMSQREDHPRFACDNRGVPVTDRWRTGEEGIGAFDAWCVARRWPMVRVPTERDIGIDGFVQVTDDGGKPTGDVFAVQVKSGASYLRSTGGAVPVDGHGDLWRQASSPVIAVVHDTASGAMWWSNASDALDHNPKLTKVAVTTRLPEGDEDVMPLLRSVRLHADFRIGVPRGLGSTDVDEQVAAAWQSLFLGSRSSHALIALRRVLVSLDPVARAHAVEALGHCTPHPDIFWTKDTLLPTAIRDEVRSTFRWSLEEVVALLEVIDENGIDRGSVGQSMYMLIFEDPGCTAVLRRGALELVPRGDDFAGWAAYLAVAHAEDQQAEWDLLLRLQPALGSSFVAGYLDYALKHGGVVLD